MEDLNDSQYTGSPFCTKGPREGINRSQLSATKRKQTKLGQPVQV